MKNPFSRRTFIATTAAAILPPALAGRKARNRWPALHAVGLAAAACPTRRIRKDAGVLDLSNSPFAKLKSVPVRAVTIQDGFWSQRRKTNLDSSIPTMHDQLLAHGRMDNFLRLEGKSSAPQKGPVYSDSDIYKWTEAVGFALQTADQPELRQTTAAMIREIVATQEPSGYLNTYYVDDRKSLRMRYDTQTTGHELYCIGHMLQGAIAYYRATGDRTLLDAGIRFVDDFCSPTMAPARTRKAIVAGHPEIEMALVELYRTTGDRSISISPAIFSTATRAFPCVRSRSPTCSAACRSPRARNSKATPFAPCMLDAEPPITTWKPATTPTGRR